MEVLYQESLHFSWSLRNGSEFSTGKLSLKKSRHKTFVVTQTNAEINMRLAITQGS